MKQCPFFCKCGGCKYDFTSADYRSQKAAVLRGISATDDPVWIDAGGRRRGDFCFAAGQFGLFESHSKNIIPVRFCPNMVPAINDILPAVARLPWNAAGSCLITACDNGVDIVINANVAYFSPEFRAAVQALPAIRVSWNGRVIKQTAQPVIKFGDVSVEYPIGAFLQPGAPGEAALRRLVTDAASGASRVADLFCGLGNFTYSTHADGFDIVGIGCSRDLFRSPLTPGMLKQYDCMIMDPPRAGALAQCKELIKSNVRRVIYVSCNPATFQRDMDILSRGGYRLTKLIPVDQFVGSAHWEIFSIFDK